MGNRRNSHLGKPSVLHIHAFWHGVALFVASLFSSWGLPMVVPSTVHNGWIIIAIGVVSSAPMFLRAWELWAGRGVIPSHPKVFWVGTLLIIAVVDISLAFAVVQPPADTVVYACIQDNKYEVWAVNKGGNKDTVFVTIGTGSVIVDIQPLMGAVLPFIIEGGKNANFVTFKIDELLPNKSLAYLIDVRPPFDGKPYEFTAWSGQKASDVKATFVGNCPTISVGPEETRPTQ